MEDCKGDRMKRIQRLAAGMVIAILWMVSLSGCSNAEKNSGVQLDSTVADGIEYFLIKTEENLRSIDKPFTGIFDGNGFKISNFNIGEDIPNVGFFAAADGATIKNVTLDKVNVKGSDMFPIVNVAMNCAITDCLINSERETSSELAR